MSEQTGKGEPNKKQNPEEWRNWKAANDAFEEEVQPIQPEPPIDDGDTIINTPVTGPVAITFPPVEEEEGDLRPVNIVRNETESEPGFEEKVKRLIEGDKPEITEDEWVAQQARLVSKPWGRTNLKGILEKGNDKFSDGQINEEEWEKLASVIAEEIQRQEQAARPTPNPRPNPVAATPVVSTSGSGVSIKDLAEAFRGERLSKDDRYREMLDDEQWNNDPLQPINADQPPSFYVEMTPKERELHQIRVELNNACYLKRQKGFTLDALSKEVPYAGLSKSETEKLWNGIPGLRQAVKLYVSLIDSGREIANAETGGRYSLLSAKGRNEVLVIRNAIRNAIRDQVIADTNNIIRLLAPGDRDKYANRGLDELNVHRDILDVRCRDAEQMAFNLLFLGNTFESLDSQWNDDTERTRAPRIGSEILIMPVRNAMKPLDNLIASLGKKPEKFAVVGRFGEWAYTQTRKANRNRDLDPSKIKSVKIVSERKGNERNFWTVRNEGETLYIPECYPIKIIGSVWEETKAKVGGNDVPLIDLIRTSRNGTIDWSQVEGEDMWATYGFRLGKAGQVWDLLQGKTLIRWGEYENVGLWIQDVNNALSQFGLVNEASIKRWILYASAGIDPKRREPHLRDRTRKLHILGQLGPRMGNYLPHDQLLFPWDGRGLF